MRTERQIEASRANGAKSRGPVTAEGKRNSSRNSTRHGMLAESVVLDGESEARFLELLAEIDGELQPETPVEHALVHKMAVAQWRQFRLWTLEKTAIDHQIRKEAQTVGCNEHKATCTTLAFRSLADESRSLDLLHRYDSLCDRQYLRAHRRFMEMRRDRGGSRAPSEPTPEPEVMPHPEECDSEAQGPPYAAPKSGGTLPSSRESAAMTCACSLDDLISPAAWDPFLPEPSEKIAEKQPNEPNNSLETKQPPDAEPTESREPHEAQSRAHQSRTPPPVPGHSDLGLATSSTPLSPEKQSGRLKTAIDLTKRGCKIDGSCHPLNPQDSR